MGPARHFSLHTFPRIDSCPGAIILACPRPGRLSFRSASSNGPHTAPHPAPWLTQYDYLSSQTLITLEPFRLHSLSHKPFARKSAVERVWVPAVRPLFLPSLFLASPFSLLLPRPSPLPLFLHLEPNPKPKRPADPYTFSPYSPSQATDTHTTNTNIRLGFVACQGDDTILQNALKVKDSGIL
ncbi:hypothetical protein D9615_009834 [Tricholomella constricta]|uniref:Uncharacterized protein n=1 Tax=Tricholomella constricta TaxID=117010 RepID=A0A8H5GXK3_9AGAR|nr:hypothetical protein D9615_009834 [Tricholomella constricta]